MYFPYLRGKQYELIAIDELSDLIKNSNKVIPIIEPVKRAFNKFQAFAEKNIPFILIVNPMEGDFREDNIEIKKGLIKNVLHSYDNYYLGYIIGKDTKLMDIDNFLELNSDKKICIIHYNAMNNPTDLLSVLNAYPNLVKYNIFIDGYTGEHYQNIFNQSNRVLIKDGFKRERKNSDYPERTYFSDLNINYNEIGYDGFGDFLMVGDEYSVSGGPAYTVAIHHTFLNEDGSLSVRHFISNTNHSPVDPANKFLEALEKFAMEIGSKTKDRGNLPYDDPRWITNSCKDFFELYDEQNFRGLGIVKKISMKHHMELIINNIS